jgi:hypothetical protein
MDDVNNYRTMVWEVTVIDLIMSSNFTQNSINALGDDVNFTYIPSGGVEKTAEFYLDDVLIGTRTLGARILDEQSFTITGQTLEGVYKLKARLSTVDGNRTIYSEYIYRDLIWRSDSSSSTIISSPYRGRTVDIKQFEEITIPYTIAGPSTSYTV